MKNGLRIALVSAFPPGMQSLNEYGLHLTRHLATHPDVQEVVVIADKLGQVLPEVDLGPKIQVKRTWAFNSLTSCMSILRALRQERADGVVYNLQTASFGDRELSAGLGLLAPMLSRVMGIPSGIIAHNLIAGIDLDQTILKGQRLRQAVVTMGGKLITRAMLAADYMTVTLKSYSVFLHADYPRADVTLVPHGTFDTVERQWIPQDRREMKIATMGKFGTYKRLETILAAFDILRKKPEFEDIRLVIGGTDHPNTPGYVANLAATRSNDESVEFGGYIPEDSVPGFFESAKASVFDYESTTGSSGVLHQTAMYGAVPVFPRIGDFVDLCEDEGLAGHNYAPGDAVGMAAAIAEVLVDPKAAESLARANRKASLGMPFFDVVDFHVQKIKSLQMAKSR